MRLAVVGCGAVGSQLVRLLRTADIDELVLVDRHRSATLAAEFGSRARAATRFDGHFDAVVIATRWGKHPAIASQAVRHAPLVVSVADSLEDVRGLLDLDAEARERHAVIVVGAGFAPGFTGVLARFLSRSFSRTEEIHIARVGTGGPWCARQHHRALGSSGLDYRDGAWMPRAGGSGRELFWFPEPIGGRDCYRAALPDPMLLVPLFPGVGRVTARVAATRRDRLTARLPMLTPPHPDGGLGAVRVELRGLHGGEHAVVVAAATAAPSVATAIVAMATVQSLTGDGIQPGAAPLAGLVDPCSFLASCRAAGLVAREFVGAS